MTPPNADRRRPAGGDVDEDCTPRIPHTGDMDETIAELVVSQDAGAWPIFAAGFHAGYRCGVSAGYREGLAVLDEAGALLGELRPSDGIDAAAARRRRIEYRTPALTADEIRRRAEASWARPGRQQQGRRAG